MMETETLLTREGAALELKLRRAGGAAPGAPAVLLLHGGNSSGLTFMAPKGGLVGYLCERGIDVWLLEWRASPFVVDPLLTRAPIGGSVEAERRFFNLDWAASEDIPLALARIRERIGDAAPLAILGHCLAGALVAMATARGMLEPFDVSSVILLTLGLFCEVPWSGWLKAEDSILERIVQNDPECRGIDPKRCDGWPADIAEAYRAWPNAWLPDGAELLRALSFMVGRPYDPGRVAQEFSAPDVERYFGTMHLGIYLHAGQIVRRGLSAPFDAPELVHRSRLTASSEAVVSSDLRSLHFKNKHLTLLAAADNDVWHRDSIDLMFEWLRNEGCSNSVKHVLRGYNLQELLWGVEAEQRVYPLIEQGIRAARGLEQRSAAE